MWGKSSHPSSKLNTGILSQYQCFLLSKEKSRDAIPVHDTPVPLSTSVDEFEIQVTPGAKEILRQCPTPIREPSFNPLSYLYQMHHLLHICGFSGSLILYTKKCFINEKKHIKWSSLPFRAICVIIIYKPLHPYNIKSDRYQQSLIDEMLPTVHPA